MAAGNAVLGQFVHLMQQAARPKRHSTPTSTHLLTNRSAKAVHPLRQVLSGCALVVRVFTF